MSKTESLFLVFEGFGDAHREFFRKARFTVLEESYSDAPELFKTGGKYFWNVLNAAGVRVGVTGFPDMYPVPLLGSGFFHAGFPYMREPDSAWPTWDKNIVEDPILWGQLPGRDGQNIQWRGAAMAYAGFALMEIAFSGSKDMLTAFLKRAALHKISTGLVWFTWPARLRQLTANYSPLAEIECGRALQYADMCREAAKRTYIVGLVGGRCFVATRQRVNFSVSTLRDIIAADVSVKDMVAANQGFSVRDSLTAQKFRRDIRGSDDRVVGKA